MATPKKTHLLEPGGGSLALCGKTSTEQLKTTTVKGQVTCKSCINRLEPRARSEADGGEGS